MRTAKLTVAALFLLLNIVLIFTPAMAADTWPASGTYFIVSHTSGEALQPVMASVGQSVEAHAFDKSGAQKWQLTRLIDAKTKKPTNRYEIRVAGEIQGLNLQPHDIAERSALINSPKSIFVLEPKSDAFLFKAVKRNGDAMCIYPVTNAPTEVHFGPNDDSGKFLWDVQPAN